MSLTKEEKGQLAKKISRGTQVICSSIAQLHLGSPDPNALLSTDETGIIRSLREHGMNRWKFTNIEGALLLTKDRNNICNFRIYDLDAYKLRFQYELYENMDYQQMTPSLHAFEMESCVCGFCFSSDAVAARFYERVQLNIIKNQVNVRREIPPILSPGFQRPPEDLGRFDQGAESAVSSGISNMEQTGNLFLQNGLLDPNNVPNEWKRILKQAGIKKKDLQNPTMQDLIRDALAQYDISLDPPPLDMDDAEIRKYYTPEQLREYEQYKRDLAAYEEDMRRYEREKEEYEEQQRKQKRLEEMLRQNEAANTPTAGKAGMSGADRLRHSVMQFTGQEIRDVLPVAQQEEKMAPRMSVAAPLVPALPPIPKEKEPQSNLQQALNNAKMNGGITNKQEKLRQMVDSRNSKMMLKANFLKDIQGQEFALRRVSALPKLDKMPEVKKDGLLNLLRERIQAQRRDIGEEDDDDEDDQFSDPDDEF